MISCEQDATVPWSLPSVRRARRLSAGDAFNNRTTAVGASEFLHAHSRRMLPPNTNVSIEMRFSFAEKRIYEPKITYFEHSKEV